MTFLTPLGGLLALAALLPLAATLFGGRRAGAVRHTLGLAAPARRSGFGRLAAATAGIALLGLAAAQPALTHESRARIRSDVQALFVLDTSRSMAASATATSPTRIDRAVAAAVRLRAAIPEVDSGVATLTDRVLPDLFPVSDLGGFDGVVRRAVAIESPGPRSQSVRATTYSALAEIPAGNYFDPSVTRRIVVLLTDGESTPVDSGEIARTLSATRGYELVTVRFWQAHESVFDSGGRPETAYRPDPAGHEILAGLAAAAGGRAFEEAQLGGVSAFLRHSAGQGPTVVSRGTTRDRVPLAPYFAALALALFTAAVAPFRRRPFQAGRTSVGSSA